MFSRSLTSDEKAYQKLVYQEYVELFLSMTTFAKLKLMLAYGKQTDPAPVKLTDFKSELRIDTILQEHLHVSR